jgi:hypothetical protein
VKIIRVGAGHFWAAQDFTLRRHATVNSIVPPAPKMRRITRRVKAYRCSVSCMVFGSVAIVALIALDNVRPGLSIWAQLLGFCAAGLAVVAGIGAVVYRFVEAPQEITIPVHPAWDQGRPPWIHPKRNE